MYDAPLTEAYHNAVRKILSNRRADMSREEEREREFALWALLEDLTAEGIFDDTPYAIVLQDQRRIRDHYLLDQGYQSDRMHGRRPADGGHQQDPD